ncbi:MAG: zinc-dependent metalloprotease [Burkholderiaceae bacterium]|nr:zinc-dependent metalloprotease [Burkholderiaceae bacterium]
MFFQFRFLSRLILLGFSAFVVSACSTIAVPQGPQASTSSPSTPIGAPASAASSATGATPTSTGPTVPPGPARPAPSITPPAAAGAPRPFAEVIKDAKQQAGLFSLWIKDEKVWIEIKPEQFEQLYYLQTNLSRGVMGEAGISTALGMLRGNIVMFKKVGSNVQLIARNFSNYAKPGTPIALATSEGTSDSLLAAASVASAPHPEKKSVLVEANALLLGDIPMITYTLDTVYRAGYSMDRANSYFRETHAREDATTFDVTAHFSLPKLPIPTPSLTPSPIPQPRPVTGVPDARSFFIGLFYTLSKLPDEPMHPRAADGRIGHFNQKLWDFSDKEAAFARKYVINRWRLEKKDPTAALSEPKKPITYWLDKNIPLEYRDTVKAGVLEWNKAFEKIGFKNAIRVEQQPEDASWSTHETNRASVRWFVDYSDGALAVGPSRIDPRTGEILDADITIGNGWVTLPRRRALEQYPKPMPALSNSQKALEAPAEIASNGFLPVRKATALPRNLHIGPDSNYELCSYGQSALEEASFALDLLEMRAAALGTTLDPKEAERIAQATLKDVVTHEVGHTLGFRHNFRASIIYTQEQINNLAFTRSHGISGSVMDYNAFNVALEKEPQSEFVMSTLGPYDYWAVEYAYRELPAATEKEELEKIAARSSEPLLAYGTDEELAGDFDGMDPQINQRDVGGDPLEFARRRLKLSRELFDRLQTRQLPPGTEYDALTRNFISGLGQLSFAFEIAAKYVGGVIYLRDQVGSKRSPLTPVAVEKQRAALQFLTDNLFSANGFDLKPEFVSRLTDSTLDRGYTPPADRSLDTTLLTMQTQILDRLLSTRVAERLQNARNKLASPKTALTLNEVYSTITHAIWGEGPSTVELSPARRALQREHARRLAAAITRPATGGASGDARALHRLTAKTLLAKAIQAKSKPALSAQTRAHLDEIADTLEAALKAQASRVVG